MTAELHTHDNIIITLVLLGSAVFLLAVATFCELHVVKSVAEQHWKVILEQASQVYTIVQLDPDLDWVTTKEKP